MYLWVGSKSGTVVRALALYQSRPLDSKTSTAKTRVRDFLNTTYGSRENQRPFGGKMW